MRHRMRGRRLGRSSSHRIALSRNLIAALFRHGRIETTLAKAKEYKPTAEKLITLARTKDQHRMRLAMSRLQDRDAVQRLFDEIAPSFAERPGGYCRIVRLAGRRLGDQGARALLELVNYVPGGAGAGDGEGSPSAES